MHRRSRGASRRLDFGQTASEQGEAVAGRLDGGELLLRQSGRRRLDPVRTTGTIQRTLMYLEVAIRDKFFCVQPGRENRAQTMIVGAVVEPRFYIDERPARIERDADADGTGHGRRTARRSVWRKARRER